MLRPPEPGDEEVLGALRNDVALQRALLSRPRPSGVERVRRWLDCVAEDPSVVLFVIAERPTGEPVGFVQVVDMDFISSHGRLGIALSEPARGRGLGVRALDLVARFVDDVFSVRKLILHVRADNAAAVATYQKAGYREVGIHREHFYAEGTFHDVMVMERLTGS